MNIAVVDDEKSIREVIRLALEKEFYSVAEYPDGASAWEAFRKGLPELIVLDILMPRMDGIELCKKVRSLSSRVPIIFLSSRDEEIDRVLGLESGGDDYVCKPFSIRELMARIRASLRRLYPERDGGNGGSGIGGAGGFSGGPDGAKAGPGGSYPPPFVLGSLVMDENRHFSSWMEKPVELTVTEFRILKCLAENPGYVKTREQLMQAAFPEDNYPNDRAADSHIKRIRRKFAAVDERFDVLEAVYGFGYRYRESC